MDYTQNKELMQVLTELAHELDGYQYSSATGYASDTTVMKHRTESVNAHIEQVKQLLLQTQGV